MFPHAAGGGAGVRRGWRGARREGPCGRLDANLTGLDPADLNDNISQSAARLMFEGLYMLDEHMKLQPQLAESYEATEDAKEFTFHLRKGVTFHDGTPFNAAAVKFSFDRAGNPENHLKRQSLYVMIDHTDVVDDYTVQDGAEISVRRLRQRHRASGRADRVAEVGAGVRQGGDAASFRHRAL